MCVGSDDGCVYALDAASGALQWKYLARGNVQIIPGNGRLVSSRPVRTGLLVHEGVLYGCAGMFPTEGVDLFALDPATGNEHWRKEVGVAAQGYLVASSTRLYVPTGRTAPVVFDLATGARIGSVECPKGEGGGLRDVGWRLAAHGTRHAAAHHQRGEPRG